MRISTWLLAGTFLAPLALAAGADETRIPVVQPTLETANLPDNGFGSDADDPAFWVHPANPAKSLVVASAKNGGIRVYDLQGGKLQTIDPLTTEVGEGRINNVDVAYGLRMADGTIIDVAVASDRGLDLILVYRINGDSETPLTEITDLTSPRAFLMRPAPSGYTDEANPVKDQHTAYGLALWSDKATGKLFAVGTQRTEPRVGLFSLTPTAAGKVRVEMTADYRVAATYKGQDLRQANDNDPLKDWNPQFEGVVVDQRSGVLYAGEEDVGIWRIDLKTGKVEDKPMYETRGARGSSFTNAASVISRDVEGLTIFYGAGNTAYLIASSQGGAHGEDGVADAPYDDTFVVFDLSGPAKLLGSFRVGANADRKIDAVQESDGAAVISMALPGWPNGLFVTQDGYNDDLNGLDGETAATNFKFVDWKSIADSFIPPLAVAPTARSPR